MNSPITNKVRIHPHVTVGEVVGSRVDARAWRRRRRGRGGVRHVRWCVEVLRDHADDTPVLAVDYDYAERLEDYLIDHVRHAPSSARKAIQHLLALRRQVAGLLHLPQLPSHGIHWSRWPIEPEITIEDYSLFRPALQPRSRVAADLVTACRLKPATVLRLKGPDVGAGGRTLRVRGRTRNTLLSVPRFLWDDLAGLAAVAGRGGYLFPGRSKAGSTSPVTLRKHVQAASEEVLGVEVSLRDLGRLGASILGPSSANPAGRAATLDRVAAGWHVVETPPVVEVKRLVDGDDHDGRDEDDEFHERLDLLEQQVETLQEKANDWEGKINGSWYIVEGLGPRVTELERAQKQPSLDERPQRPPLSDPELRAALDKHEGRLARLEKRPRPVVIQGPTVRQMGEIQSRQDRLEGQLRRTRSAVAAQVIWTVCHELADAGVCPEEVLDRIAQVFKEEDIAEQRDSAPYVPPSGHPAPHLGWKKPDHGVPRRDPRVRPTASLSGTREAGHPRSGPADRPPTDTGGSNWKR